MFDEVKNWCVRLPHILTSTSRLTYASIGVGLLVAFLYFKLFFQDASQFWEDAKNTANGRTYGISHQAPCLNDMQCA